MVAVVHHFAVEVEVEVFPRQPIATFDEGAIELLAKIKEQLAGMDHPFDKPTTRATLIITIRVVLWQELPESYSEESINYYRDTIYNYVFYPSRQGNKQIKLNQIALSKIQTFHTTFGEDNQIYSTEEIIDRDLDKLFSEGIKREQEDRNVELPFYEELRSLYQQNRKEYKRIERLSLRSRTGRKPREVEGVTLSGDTLVFLKTNFRKVFYLVNDEQTRELSVLDALHYFKAQPEEQPVARIAQHHDHVEKAVKQFRVSKEEEIHEEESNQNQRSNLGAQVTTAVSLLNSMLPHIEDGDVRLKIIQLKELAERGTITYIAKRLQRIQKDLQRQGGSKAKMGFDEALKQVLEMANHYNAYYRDTQHAEEESDATIILSESFQ